MVVSRPLFLALLRVGDLENGFGARVAMHVVHGRVIRVVVIHRRQLLVRIVVRCMHAGRLVRVAPCARHLLPSLLTLRARRCLPLVKSVTCHLGVFEADLDGFHVAEELVEAGQVELGLEA